MTAKTTAGIVNWNSGRHLQACVESLSGEAVEIVVFDNHSEDASLTFLGSSGGVIKSAENLGFAGGVNEILRRSTTPYVLILNPDIRVERGSIQLMEDFMDAHPRAAAVGGYAGEKYLPRSLPTSWSLVRENLGLPMGAAPPSQRESSLPAPSSPREGAAPFPTVEQVAAAAIMIRRDVCVDDLMFDPQFYPAWYEDVDFCRRLKNKGWEVHFIPQAKFIHDGGYSAKAMGSGPFHQAYYLNQLRYARKWFGPFGTSAVRASIAIGMIGRMIARPRHSSGYAKVFCGALFGW